MKKTKTGGRIPPGKSRAPLFNLLKAGSGIRFSAWNDSEKNKVNLSPRIVAAAVVLLALFTASLLFVNKGALEPVSEPAFSVIHRVPTLQNEVVAPDITVVARPGETASDTHPAAGAAVRLRFGIFTAEDNAQKLAAGLALKKIAAEVVTGTRLMPAFFLKCGPAKDVRAFDEMQNEAKKLNVAPWEAVEAKYVNIGPIWLKDRALNAEKILRASKVPVKIEEAKKARNIFMVVSPSFESRDAAKDAVETWKQVGVESVVDE